MSSGPTQKRDFVSIGDTVVVTGQNMVGKVLRVVPSSSLPYAVVQWPTSIGRHSITTLQKITQTNILNENDS